MSISWIFNDRWSGVSSKPVYEEIAHSTKIWGNPENFRPWMFPFFSNGMWEFIFIFFLKDFKEGICDKKARKRWNMWCLKSLCRLYIYIFRKHSSRWGALSSSEKYNSRKATALIPKEEILNNANFFISIWAFDNSIYLQKTCECITTILIIIFSTQIYNIIFDFAYAGHKFQKAITWATKA